MLTDGSEKIALKKEAMTKHDQDKRRNSLDKKHRTNGGPQFCLTEDSQKELDDNILMDEKGDGDRSSLLNMLTYMHH